MKTMLFSDTTNGTKNLTFPSPFILLLPIAKKTAIVFSTSNAPAVFAGP